MCPLQQRPQSPSPHRSTVAAIVADAFVLLGADDVVAVAVDVVGGVGGVTNECRAFMVPASWTAPRPAGNPSGTRPGSVGRRCSRPFWRKCSLLAPLPSPRDGLTSKRPTCRRLPEGEG